jgi:hypothetical protein
LLPKLAVEPARFVTPRHGLLSTGIEANCSIRPFARPQRLLTSRRHHDGVDAPGLYLRDSPVGFPGPFGFGLPSSPRFVRFGEDSHPPPVACSAFEVPKLISRLSLPVRACTRSDQSTVPRFSSGGLPDVGPDRLSLPAFALRIFSSRSTDHRSKLAIFSQAYSPRQCDSSIRLMIRGTFFFQQDCHLLWCGFANLKEDRAPTPI